MAAGIALTDADRQGWLQTLSARLGAAKRDGQAVVLACSALKRSYREVLRSQADDLALVYLAGTPELLAQRMFEIPATPSITTTSPGRAKLWASNSAILFTCWRAVS